MEKRRLTLDISKDEHMYLKMSCAKLGVSMKDFMLRSALDKIEDLEDKWLAEEADKIVEDVKSGKDKMISWEEMKKRIS